MIALEGSARHAGWVLSTAIDGEVVNMRSEYPRCPESVPALVRDGGRAVGRAPFCRRWGGVFGTLSIALVLATYGYAFGSGHDRVAAGEAAFADIFQLAASFTFGRIGASESAAADGPVQQQLQQLREFLAKDEEAAVADSLTLIHHCIDSGRYHLETLDPACEGALVALGFFESPDVDRAIMKSFARYLDEDAASPTRKVGLGNCFYPRFNGLVWYSGRAGAGEYEELVLALNARYHLYAREQLEVVLRYLRDPPDRLSPERFEYPVFCVQRVLRASAASRSDKAPGSSSFSGN